MARWWWALGMGMAVGCSVVHAEPSFTVEGVASGPEAEITRGEGRWYQVQIEADGWALPREAELVVRRSDPAVQVHLADPRGRVVVPERTADTEVGFVVDLGPGDDGGPRTVHVGLASQAATTVQWQVRLVSDGSAPVPDDAGYALSITEL